MNEEEAVKSISHSNNISQVDLDDVICVGCNHCGSCCMNTQTRLNAYDIYQINKIIPSTREIIDNLTLYYGDETGLPIIGLFSSKESGLCPYLQSDINGDFQCILGDKKPSVCFHPFVAIATKFKKREFDFVPFDEKVPSLDIESYLKDNRIENNTLYYIEDGNNACKADCKSEMTVREYLSGRLADQDERNLATIIPMLFCKYFDVNKLMKILRLAENSAINSIIDDVLKNDKKLGKISKNLFYEAYFYADDPREEKESFLEQTIKQIHRLEETVLPRYRILYKYLINVFETPDKDAFDDIIEEEDYDASQKMFDKYFTEHTDEIKELFVLDMLPNMARELEMLRKSED